MKRMQFLLRPRLKPRESYPTMDDTDTMSWWRGYYSGAPLWFVLGFAVAVIVLKALK